MSCTLLVLLLSACGGPAMTTPTPIPASRVRPEQPTPIYATDAGRFLLTTPAATPQFVAPAAAAATVDAATASDESVRAAIQLFIENQTPSAVGIAPGGATIYGTPGGTAVAGVPVGGVVTVTGRSSNDDWYAVYDNDFAWGWIAAGQLRVYGGEDLVVIDAALDPAPIATLLAQTDRPVQVLDGLMVTMEARRMTPAATSTPVPTATLEPVVEAATPTALPPDEAPSALPSPTTAEAAPADTAAATGAIISEGRLNVRTTPATDAAIVRKLDPGDVVEVTARNTAGDWLRVALDDGSAGWVAAEFVEVSTPVDSLPVVGE